MSNGPDPIKNDRRRARQRQKLPPNAACLLCGVTTPEALLLVNRSLLEAHHVLGRAAAPELTVPLCKNCHALETQKQLSAGVELRHEPQRNLLEVLVSVLRAAGLFLQGLSARLLAWAEQLARLVGVLDQQQPGWRQLPEAQA